MIVIEAFRMASEEEKYALDSIAMRLQDSLSGIVYLLKLLMEDWNAHLHINKATAETQLNRLNIAIASMEMIDTFDFTTKS